MNRIRRFIVAPKSVTVQLVYDDEIIMEHTIVPDDGIGGWATFKREFGMQVGKHIAEHKNGRLIEVIELDTKRRIPAFCMRTAPFTWRIDIPEE